MTAPQPREQFEAELRRHHLLRAYIQLLLDEWDDHLADLQDERNSDMNTARTLESTRIESQPADILDFSPVWAIPRNWPR